MDDFQVVEVPGMGQVRFPATMNDEQISAAIKANSQGMPKAQPPKKPLAWSDVPGEAMVNLPSSMGGLLGNVAQAIASPLQTIGGAADVAAGALRNITPRPIANLINRFEIDPQAQERAVNAANAAGGMLKERYGSTEALKNTLATDPAGVASDVAGVLSGGGAVASRVPGMAAAGQAAARAGAAIDPLVLALKGTQAAGKGISKAVAQGVGLQTGTGIAPLAEATRVGRYEPAGGEAQTSFTQNLRGQANMTDVLSDAKTNLDAMRQAKGKEYRANEAAYANDATTLNFADIDNALNNSINSIKVTSPQGTSKYKVGTDELKKIQEVQSVIDDWRSAPDLHTVEGLDALKQRIGAIYPDNPKQLQAQRVISDAYNAVKKTIEAQAPGYAKTMKDYSEATETIREIEKALSLNNKASADTAMRKLQSLMRNNVNTSYGYRTDLARTLESEGGKQIMPALAGQALSEWSPRGLQRATALPSGGMAYMVGGPVAAATSLAASSPRLMGETAFAIGKGQRLADQLRGKIPNIPNAPISPMDAARLAQQLQRWQQQGAQQ